jgi:hypothetical protein
MEADLSSHSIYRIVIVEDRADNSESIIDNNITKQQDNEYGQVLKDDKMKQEAKRMCKFREKLKARISEERMEKE